MVLTPDLLLSPAVRSLPIKWQNSQIKDNTSHRVSHHIWNEIVPHNVSVTEDDKCCSTLLSSGVALHHLCSPKPLDPSKLFSFHINVFTSPLSLCAKKLITGVVSLTWSPFPDDPHGFFSPPKFHSGCVVFLCKKNYFLCKKLFLWRCHLKQFRGKLSIVPWISTDSFSYSVFW